MLGDRYELGEMVGAGGMARVMQARDLVLERPVAVKLLREGVAADPALRDRFLREARTAARFNHPNAVAVFDSGQDHGDPWIVMELVDGEDLSQRLRRAGPLPERDAVAIADCVLAALEAAHRQGIVHRDVKPANIMLLDDGSVKLADFGIAKSFQDAGSTLTAAGQLVGTARYVAPEMVSGAGATPASDVYAMGIVLYEMLAGQAPYTGTDPVAVAVAHTHGDVPDLAAVVPEVSTTVAAVVTRALAKDPVDRFPDAGVMRLALLGGTQPLTLAAPTTRGDSTIPLATGAAAAASTTQVLPDMWESIGDDAATLDPLPATGRRRVGAWWLLALFALPLLIVLLIGTLSSPEETPAPEPAADTRVEEAQPATPERAPAEDAAEPSAREPAKTSDTTAAPADKGKGNGKGNGKAKGKKD